MADCPNGSRVKPEQTENLIWWAGSTLVGAIPWGPLKLASLVPMIVPYLVDLDDMCSRPPPELPELDWVELWKSPTFLGVPNELWKWLVTASMNAYWSQYCECSPVSGPAPCTPPAPLRGVYTGNHAQGNTFVARSPIVHGWTRADVRFTNFSVSPDVQIGVNFVDEAFATVGALNGPTNTGVGGTYDENTTNVPGADWSRVRYVDLWARHWTGTVVTGDVGLTVTALTGGECIGEVIPPPPTGNPMPPDPPVPPIPPLPIGCTLDDVCAQLTSLSGVVGSMTKRIDILQRYGLPFAYNRGLVHASLSGEGTFPVQGLVGFQVDLNSGVPGRQLEGMPKYLWDLGWLTINTTDGMVEEVRYTRDTQVWQPLRIQEATSFGYHFKAGVVATVTELKPEPF